MALNGGLVRCVKHPSHLSLGFCSLCLVERLSIVGLTKDSLEDPIHSTSGGCEILEVSVTDPELEEREEKKPKTTLLALFELDDLRNSTTKRTSGVESTDVGSESSLKSASVEVKYRMRLLKWRRRSSASVDRKELQPQPCAMESPSEGQLRRSSSLRCACEWIACCNNNCDSTTSASYWSKFWDSGGTIFPLVLKRSLSESGNDRRSFSDHQIAQKIGQIDSRSERVDPHKKKWMLGRSFSLRSASTCSSDNKSSNGFVKFYLPSLKVSRKRAIDEHSMKKKRRSLDLGD